jgi:hypothetical protein
MMPTCTIFYLFLQTAARIAAARCECEIGEFIAACRIANLPTHITTLF